MRIAYESDRRLPAAGLSLIACDFVGQIATAVWLEKLSDAAAREALWSYALACHRGKRWESMGLSEALIAEYRRRRERQDACG